MILNSQHSSYLFWRAQPYPHLIIDDFLTPEFFNYLHGEKYEEPILTYEHDRSQIERRKKTSNLPFNPVQNYVKDKLSNYSTGVNPLKYLLDIKALFPLTDFNHTFQIFHRSTTGARLGLHVDHSHIMDRSFDYVHILNCIYYSHEVWEDSWGGELILMRGVKGEQKLIQPRPNRLVIFLHTSDSFHGVAPVTCPEHIQRESVYMDYYTTPYVCNQITTTHPTLRWWKHHTTFIPEWGGFRKLRQYLSYQHAYLKYYRKEPFII
jgi:hypothetical protein